MEFGDQVAGPRRHAPQKAGFEHLRAGFPRPRDDRFATLGASLDLGVETLEVVEVGGFEASFVPRPEDFGRLDERFRLPADLWTRLNLYYNPLVNWVWVGFAVLLAGGFICIGTRKGDAEGAE